MKKSNPIAMASHLCWLALISTTSAFSVAPNGRRSTCLYAKKKKKNKQQQKKGGFAWASSFTLQPYEASEARQLASTAISSFKGRAGQHLSDEMEEASDIPKALWSAPVACLIVVPGQSSSGNSEEEAVMSEGETTTVVRYANIAALETVGLKPEEFEQLFSTAPSKDIGVAPAKPVTISLQLPSIMKGDKKFERGYKKKMLKRKSGDVTMLDAYRWDLEQSQIVDGKFVTQSLGVAYSWSEWMVGSETICRPGGIQKKLTTEEDYDALITQQGAFIRDLKETKGMGNKDPQVVAAVAELLRLKKVQGEQE
jgi:hypothetical protein